MPDLNKGDHSRAITKYLRARWLLIDPGYGDGNLAETAVEVLEPGRQVAGRVAAAKIEIGAVSSVDADGSEGIE
jgi:hypothetical protein